MAKTSPRRRVKRPSSRDPLSVQINVVAHLPRGLKPTAALLQQAIRYRIENDEDHPNFTTRLIRWRNPSRAGKNSAWRQGNQADAWQSIGRVLKFARVEIFSIRDTQRTRKRA